jgi:heat shock protein HspQ
MKNKILIITIIILVSIICYVGYLAKIESRELVLKRKFKIGEMVKAKIDNRKGMIIEIKSSYYKIRFPINTKLYDEIFMKEFELEKIK